MRPVIRPPLLGCVLALAACDGVIGESGLNSGRSGEPNQPSEPVCGRSVCGATGELAEATAFPRLTHAQWENSVRDLLRLDALPGLSSSFEPDTRVSFFENNHRALRVSSDLWNDYQSACATAERERPHSRPDAGAHEPKRPQLG